jgi:acetolactate synthase-1/3 small subunit
MKHTIFVVVDNQFGVLARIAGLFSGRGFNITSLTVGESKDPAVSKMTIVVDDQGQPRIMEQVEKQLNKLINVIKVQDFTGRRFVDRELILVKVNTSTHTRAEILELAQIYRARVVNVAQKAIVLEVTGAEEKIEAFLKLLGQYGIQELVRTGKIALARG